MFVVCDFIQMMQPRRWSALMLHIMHFCWLVSLRVVCCLLSATCNVFAMCIHFYLFYGPTAYSVRAMCSVVNFNFNLEFSNVNAYCTISYLDHQ